MQSDRTIAELTVDFAGQVGDLVRDEVRLASAEALESFHHMVGGIVRAALGVAFAGAAITLGLIAVADALGRTIPEWAAALVAAVVGAVIAYILVKSGLKAASLSSMSLPRTRHSVAQDIKATKETLTS